MIIQLAERRLLPDGLLRFGMRRLLKQRLKEEFNRQPSPAIYKAMLLQQLRQGPIAVEQKQANQQHYEVPAAFYQQVLGPRLKYSSCYWEQGTNSLEQAEIAMLKLTCERAQLADNQRVLELGCGWGSLSLWMAETYPQSEITAISNSASQKAFIDQQAAARELTNLTVITADVATFEPGETFDRIVSVEMFEHLRNHEKLMQRIKQWLADDGLLFVHIFCHQQLFYLFETDGDDNWMGRYFFTGGVMPSFNLLASGESGLTQVNSWKVNGNHYARTLNAWLDKTDACRQQLMPVLNDSYGKAQAGLYLQRWRMFFMACAELFGYGEGEEWFVGHYLFHKSQP